ncbi:MAG: stage II sporulation protein R [Clostridiales bacterium]|nr:stage II sporulation protein R [Clostridiales bacterium]
MRYILNFTICILIAISLIGFIPLEGEGKVYDDVIRLHVIANSDSEEDQALKLLVRDEVLRRFGTAFSGYDDYEDARASVESRISDIIKAASEVVASEGYFYEVTAELCREYYPQRSYDGFALPAGKYTSLKVIIGDGAGKNWWCVLFPPLCLSAALDEPERDEGAEKKFISAGFTPEQYKIITESENPKYRLKFKIVEVFEQLFSPKQKKQDKTD